jgi:hypothetical protein
MLPTQSGCCALAMGQIFANTIFNLQFALESSRSQDYYIGDLEHPQEPFTFQETSLIQALPTLYNEGCTDLRGLTDRVQVSYPKPESSA